MRTAFFKDLIRFSSVWSLSWAWWSPCLFQLWAKQLSVSYFFLLICRFFSSKLDFRHLFSASRSSRYPWLGFFIFSNYFCNSLNCFNKSLSFFSNPHWNELPGTSLGYLLISSLGLLLLESITIFGWWPEPVHQPTARFYVLPLFFCVYSIGPLIFSEKICVFNRPNYLFSYESRYRMIF